MIITKIERQKGNPLRFNVYLDNKFSFGINEEVFLQFKLKKGDYLDNETVREIQTNEEFKLAKEKALKLIGRRNRSEKELRSKLREKEFSPQAIDHTIKYLKRIRLLDDVMFARSYINNIITRKPAGKQFLSQSLHRKGISKEVTKKILEEIFNNIDENGLAAKLASKMLKKFSSSKKKIDKKKQQRRIIEFLSRRGFSWDTISSVTKKIFKSNALTENE